MKRLQNDLSYRNLTRRPARSIALVLITAFLSFSLFGGTLLIRSMQSGLGSLRNRLGADIMVVPYEATTKADLSNILLQGNTGYFYMNSSIYEKLEGIEGVGQISPQLFLSTLSAGCCSVPVQIIGFDPETDFTIMPWIKDSYDGELKSMEVVVGNDLNAFVGDTMTFYNTDVTVAAKLKKTGTSLDTAVYTNDETIKALIQASIDLHLNTFKNLNPDKVVSCALINVADGYTVDEVLNDINIHVRKVEAVRTKNMITDVSDSLAGISGLIGALMGVVWIMALVLMGIVFSMSINERKREFALLRTIGASRRRVAGVVMREGLMIGVLGSVIGIVLALIVIVGFGTLIESGIGVPFLLPPIGQIIIFMLSSAALSAAACGVSCMIAGRRVTKGSAGELLREVS